VVDQCTYLHITVYANRASAALCLPRGNVREFNGRRGFEWMGRHRFHSSDV